MKKRMLSVTAFLLPLFVAFSQMPPMWYESRTLQFPESEYVSAIGSGWNEQAAKDDALATIALFFETKVMVSRKTALSASENSFGVSEKQRSVSSETTVASDTKLPAVSFTNVFYNETQNEYAVCAYIKKRDAINEYSGTLAAGISGADMLLKRAETAKDPYAAYSMARKTIMRLKELFVTAQYLSVLDGKSGAETVRSIDLLSSRCDAVMRRAKPKLTFGVRIQNDADGSVRYTIQQLLESKGFSCGLPNPSFIISGNIQLTESKNAVGVFVRPAISLQVSAVDGKNGLLGSYSRQYPKYGHNTLDGARAKARVEIEKDLKANLLDSLF